MKTCITLFLCFVSCILHSQITYGTPPQDSCPEKLENLRRAIQVQHFPQINDPIKIKDTYYWKHATSILSNESQITITEYGAYLYYNNTWNLRKSYNLKELDKSFGTKKQQLAQGEPYTWPKNWRTDKRLFGGWALWYFIGTTQDGETVCGYQMIHTTDNLLN